MGKVPDGFTVTNVKLMKKGGLEVNFTHEEKEKSVIHEEVTGRKSPRNPHPDMLKALKALKVFLAEVYSITTINVLREAKELSKAEKTAFETLKKRIDSMVNTAMNKITVTGYSASSGGVVVSGTMTVEGNKKIPLNTTFIKLDQNLWGFEDKLQGCIYKIENEAELFLFEGKAADLEIAFPEQNEEPKTEDKKEKAA